MYMYTSVFHESVVIFPVHTVTTPYQKYLWKMADIVETYTVCIFIYVSLSVPQSTYKSVIKSYTNRRSIKTAPRSGRPMKVRFV